MKKRLLITSIVMMLVVAVALSTATYAWFTSNATVTANSISLEAATNAEDALGIGWTTATIGTSITPNDFTTEGGLVPAIPNTVTAETVYGAETFSFKGGSIRNENSNDVYNTVSAVTPYVWNGTISDTTYDSFFLKNLSTGKPLSNLYMSAYIDGEGAEMVRMAVFVKDSGSFKLVGVLGYSYTYTSVAEGTFSESAIYYKKGTTNHNDTYDGTSRGFVKDTTITAENFEDNKANLYTRTASTTDVYYGVPATNGARVTTHTSTVTSINLLEGAEVSLDPLGTIELKVVVWLDGDKLDDQTQGRDSNIKLNFAAASAPSFN